MIKDVIKPHSQESLRFIKHFDIIFHFDKHRTQYSRDAKRKEYSQRSSFFRRKPDLRHVVPEREIPEEGQPFEINRRLLICEVIVEFLYDCFD
jgi:hypothetical protein